MSGKKHAQEIGNKPQEHKAALSWWRWRPGIKPLYATLLGGLLSLLALFLLTNGLATLVGGILDATAPPVQEAGIVTEHTTSLLGSPELIIHISPAIDQASQITLPVSSAVATSLPDGTHVIVDYAPHLHAPAALEASGKRYAIPNNGIGSTIASLAVLLSGLLLLPYPLLLGIWGWRDLRSGLAYQTISRVLALRATQPTTHIRDLPHQGEEPRQVQSVRNARATGARVPGILPRGFRPWYGVAVQDEDTPDTRPLIFAIQSETYVQLQTGDRVEVTYSPHLHYLYSLKRLANGE